MVRVGEATAHRGIALEEAREGVTPQVEHGRGGAGEEEREEERDADERERDARRAAADVLARGGAQGGREAGEEPARDSARYGEMWRDVGRCGYMWGDIGSYRESPRACGESVTWCPAPSSR